MSELLRGVPAARLLAEHSQMMELALSRKSAATRFVSYQPPPDCSRAWSSLHFSAPMTIILVIVAPLALTTPPDTAVD